MKITVVGATGAQGGAVARLALARGHEVRRMTRNPQGPLDVYGDLDDPASLPPAFSGADAVFAVTTPFNTNTHAETRRGITLVNAARDVGHVVFTSATNADLGTGIPHFDSKYEIERHLAATHPQWTVIGPAAFMDDKGSGPLRLPIPPEVKLHLIAVEDIAALAVLAFEQPERFRNRRVDIASDLLTGPEIAALRGSEFTSVPIEQAEHYSPDLAAMFRYFTEVGLDVDIPALQAEFPEVGWHTYEEWLAKAAAASAAE